METCNFLFKTRILLQRILVIFYRLLPHCKLTFKKISYFIFGLARWAETFGAFTHAKHGPSDLELRTHRDKALKKVCLQQNSSIENHFSWYIHLAIFERSLSQALRGQHRLSPAPIVFNLSIRACKGTFIFLAVIADFIMRKEDSFAIARTPNSNRSASYMIYHPNYCQFDKEHLGHLSGFRIFANNDPSSLEGVICHTKISMSLQDLFQLFSLFFKNPIIPPSQIRKVLLLQRFLKEHLLFREDILDKIKHMFVYEGSNPTHSTLIAFAKARGISTFQYYAQPVIPYEILYHIKADYLLMTKFPDKESEPFQVIEGLPNKLAYIKLKNPGIEPTKNKTISCGIVLDMFDFNGTNKREEIRNAIECCQAKKDLQVALKFHPQILKRPSHVLGYHLKKIGLTSTKMVYRGNKDEFLKSVTVMITNSESSIIQDALFQGIPVIFFSASPSIYIAGIYEISPRLLRICKDLSSLNKAILEFSDMSFKKRIQGQKEFFDHNEKQDNGYPQLVDILSDL